MKRIFLVTTIFFLLVKSYSQTIASDYIIGAWTDTIISKTGGGFIFSPDSCLSFIINGEPTECIIENQNLKVHYSVNYNVIPRQLDILLINLKADTLMGIIPMIFEIIDDNNIKLATYKTKSSNRPIDFSPGENVEVAFLTRYTENQ